MLAACPSTTLYDCVQYKNSTKSTFLHIHMHIPSLCVSLVATDLPLCVSDGDRLPCAAVVHVVVCLQLPDVGLAGLRMEHTEEHVDGRLLVGI